MESFFGSLKTELVHPWWRTVGHGRSVQLVDQRPQSQELVEVAGARSTRHSPVQRVQQLGQFQVHEPASVPACLKPSTGA